MKTSELTGALLDYWTARAEGIPADQLEIREVPRTDWKICVQKNAPVEGRDMRLAYSTDWLRAGPLLVECRMDLFRHCKNEWEAQAMDENSGWGETPLIAICRAVVRAAFGDEVEDLPCA